MKTTSQTFKELLPYIRPHSKSIASCLGCITLGASINVAIPLMLRDLSEKEGIDVPLYTVTILVLFLVYHIASCFGHYRASIVARKVDTTLCAAALQRWNSIPFVDAVARSPEIVASQVITGARHTGDAIQGALTDLYQSVIFLVCFTVALIYTSPQLCVILAIIAGLNKTVTSFLSSDFSAKSEELQQRQGTVLKYLIHGGLYQSTIRLFHLRNGTEAQFSAHLQALRDAASEVDWRLHSSSGAMFCFNNTLYVLLIAAARHYKDSGHLTTGDVLIFFFYVKRWLDHIGDIGKEVGKIRVVVGLTDSLRDLLRRPPDPRNNQVCQPTSTSGKRVPVGTVHLQDVHYSYGAAGFTLSLQPGKLYGIVGRSGEGKTTLMRLMTSLLHATAGTVERGAHMMLCEQDAGVLSGTVFENIAFGKDGKATKEEVERASRFAAFDDVVAGLPNGYDTNLRCEGEMPLSGGQIQRLCLARAFVSEARIMIFDEPTKGLDAASAAKVVASLQRLVNEGRAVVVVTHALNQVQNAERIFLVQKGRIAAEGSPTELSTNALYRDLLQCPEAAEYRD